MSAGPEIAPTTSGPTLKLEHWIFGSAPGVGYSVLAKSEDLNLSFYARRLDGIYTPLSGENLHGDETVVDVLMTHPASSGNELLFSLIGPGPLDEEFRRRTFVNHTAVVPVSALKSGRLGFEDVERAIRAYDAAPPPPGAPVRPLTVPVRALAGPPTWAGNGIAKYLSEASAETLLTRLMKEPEGRTLILSRDTGPADRRRMLTKVLEACALACGLPFVSAMSDAPALPVAARFQLVVSARAFRTDNSWALLDNALEAPSLPRVDNEDARYAALSRCFQADPGSA